MSGPLRFVSLLFLAAMLVQPAALAQDPELPELVRDVEEHTPRKTPRLLLRPAESTPAAQLAHADGLREAGRAAKAARQYRALVHTWHDAAEAPKAQLQYAEILEQRRKYKAAFEELQYLIDNYAGHFPYGEVLDRQFRLATYYMTTRVGGFAFFPGFSRKHRALEFFEKIVRNAPDWERSPEAYFNIGLVYEATGHREEAIAAYETVRHRYPASPFASKAAFKRAEALLAVANSNRRDETRCRDALSAFATFERDFPDSPDVETAQKSRGHLQARLEGMYFERASYYDLIAKRPDSAIIAYGDYVRRFPLSDLAERANERMEKLKSQMQKEEQQ